MIKTKIKVPEAGVAAAVGANPGTCRDWKGHVEWATSIIERFILWQKENVQHPTDCQFWELINACRDSFGVEAWEKGTEWMRAGMLCHEWVRRMYDATEPEVSEAIKDLLLPDIESGFFKPEVVNERMAECFRRGQKTGIYRFGFTGFKTADHPVLAEWLADAESKGVDAATTVAYSRGHLRLDRKQVRSDNLYRSRPR